MNIYKEKQKNEAGKPASENNLFYYRSLAKLSQAALAEGCDCSRRTIGNIENGKESPTITMAYRISNFLSLPLQTVFPDTTI